MSAPVRLGRRVAEARREATLSQTELGDRIGLTLWDVERLERGELDPSPHITVIARATGKDGGWFSPGGAEDREEPPGTPAPPRVEASERRERRAVGLRRDLVLGSLATVVLVRFFTEVLPVLPRAANFIDVPLFVVLAVAAAFLPGAGGRVGGSPIFAATVAFLALSILSTLFNLTRIEPAPVLVFVYSFLAPLGFYFAAWRLWPIGHAAALSRLLVTLGVLELAVVAVVDLPRFFASGNPDQISGTFGENAYQLVFFLLVFAALLGGIQTFERRRTASRLALPLMGAAFLVIFLAQYRALLVTTAVSVILGAALLSSVRGRGILVATLTVLCLIAGLSVVARSFPTLYLEPTLRAIRQDPGYFVSAKIDAFSGITALYRDDPTAAVIGTGPGTYSSRAWRTFAQFNSKSPSNVAGAYAGALIGGQVYETDVARRYVEPQYHNAKTVLGSKATSLPFSSYVALLAEVGVFGFMLVVVIYGAATVGGARQTLAAMRDAAPDDPLPALLLACTVAFATLMQMAFLDNWLEVTRVTVIAWVLLAVATKELTARRRSRAQGPWPQDG
jgi:DNA-binding XRE family transcriptional regulator